MSPYAANVIWEGMKNAESCLGVEPLLSQLWPSHFYLKWTLLRDTLWLILASLMQAETCGDFWEILHPVLWREILSSFLSFPASMKLSCENLGFENPKEMPRWFQKPQCEGLSSLSWNFQSGPSAMTCMDLFHILVLFFWEQNSTTFSALSSWEIHCIHMIYFLRRNLCLLGQEPLWTQHIGVEMQYTSV